MASNDCSCCRFFQAGFGDRIGICRRYPAFHNRSFTEWCGEFQEKMIALTVVEMKQTDEKSVETPREKRKYTRRKNVETSA